MSRIESAFFAALKHTIAEKPLNREVFLNLSIGEWESLYNLSRNQGVLAIVFNALGEVVDAIPTKIRLQWAFATMQIEDRNEKQWCLANEVCNGYSKSGIRTVVLKGFALSRYYPKPNHRECGDFDCYLMGDFERGNQIAKALGAKVHFDDYKHSHINYKGLMIENHKFCSPIRGPKINKQFERDIQRLLNEEGGLIPLNDSTMYSPSPTFNALFLIKHSMVHFLYEGIKIRHILDWLCLIQSEGKNIDWSYVNHWCKLLHLSTFVDLMNAMANRYLGLELPYMKISPNDKEVGRFVYSILYDDNSVYNNTYPTVWHQRCAIMKNMVANRWKFRDVYKKSLILELMKSSLYAVFEKHPKL